jgi:hypothetical protein
MRKTLFLTLCLLAQVLLFAQEKQVKVACVGFYNFENLFDTLDSPDTQDEEFLPNGTRNWTSKIYQEKLGNLAKVVGELGTDLTPDGPAILGVAEIENRLVLEDFVKQPAVAKRRYQIVHYDSPDERGIDVALLYNPKYFTVRGSEAIPMKIFTGDGKEDKTRDILYVAGELDGEPLHILVNHWPSRRGGEKATQPFRNAAALTCKQVKDSLLRFDPHAKVIVMGDLNDDPVSPSLKEVLAAKYKVKDVQEGDFFNPMYAFYKEGHGTMAYQDAWSLFDQIVISEGLVNKKQTGFYYHKAHVHNKPYLIQKTGQFKGYPFRTFDFDNYIGGYSDHFAVCVYLVKEVVSQP